MSKERLFGVGEIARHLHHPLLVRTGCLKGVLNLVMGQGSVVGQAMLDSPEIDAMSFTGAVQTGKRVAEASILHMRKVQLEMGCKNPLVVLNDSDLDVAVNCALNGAFFSTGQRCTASSRLVVQEGIHDHFVKALIQRLKKLVVDDALKPGTGMGPVVDERQLSRDKALAVANDTPFGLSSGICTTSLKYATHFKRNAEAGVVMVNLPTAGIDFHVPFGGRKGSSFGPKEQGAYAKEFFTQVKTAYTLRKRGGWCNKIAGRTRDNDVQRSKPLDAFADGRIHRCEISHIRYLSGGIGSIARKLFDCGMYTLGRATGHKYPRAMPAERTSDVQVDTACSA